MEGVMSAAPVEQLKSAKAKFPLIIGYMSKYAIEGSVKPMSSSVKNAGKSYRIGETNVSIMWLYQMHENQIGQFVVLQPDEKDSEAIMKDGDRWLTSKDAVDFANKHNLVVYGGVVQAHILRMGITVD
jgi:hypothetical protein